MESRLKCNKNDLAAETLLFDFRRGVKIKH